jgi:hypothetical protein
MLIKASDCARPSGDLHVRLSPSTPAAGSQRSRRRSSPSSTPAEFCDPAACG